MKPCSHRHATQVAKLLVANPQMGHGLYTKRIYWCHRCGALAVTYKERGGPNRGEWELPLHGAEVVVDTPIGQRMTAAGLARAAKRNA